MHGLILQTHYNYPQTTNRSGAALRMMCLEVSVFVLLRTHTLESRRLKAVSIRKISAII